MAGYTRQSSAQILTGEVVRAAPLNAEFNQVQSAFNSSTGHTHSGATGEGPVIDRIGDTNQYNLVFVNDSLNEIEFFTEVSSSPAKQISIADGVIKPAVTNDLDLGSSSNKFKDIYIAGTSYLDSVDINGGTLDNVSIGATTPGTGSFTTLNTSGNIGIGTSNPLTELDVSGNARLVGTSTETRYLDIGAGRTGNGYAHIDLIGDATYTDFGARFIRFNSGPNAGTSIQHRGTGGLSLVAEDAGSVQFYTSNTERMRIDSSGNVGIGLSNPAKKLDVDGQLRIRNGGATGYALLEYGSNVVATNNWHVGSEGDGSFRFYNGNFGAGIERMRIDSSGNVGIGTSSPSEPLEVSGKIKTTSGGVEFPDGTTQTTAAAPPGTVGSAVDGTATVPAFSFTSDNNTGLFRDGSGTVKVTSDGTEELTLLRSSQAQAEAGTNNSVMMTPLRTAQAIQELSPNNAIPLSFVGFL